MTIKDVAKYSGVSISTISRVMNNHPDVKEEVRAKVLAAIQELHYVPNSSARDLVKTQSDSVGVVLRGVGNPFLISVLHSIENAVREAGYTMVLHQIGTDEDELKEGAGLVRSKRLRGLIFLGGRFDYTLQDVAPLGVPFVCCTFTNSFGTLDKSCYSSVYIDDYVEAYRAVGELIRRGHRKIAVLLGSTNDRSVSELRYKGYLAALSDAGIEADTGLIVQAESFDMADAYDAVKQLAGKRRDFTALFCIADTMGIAAISALCGAGVKIPQDCSVISIDGIDVSQYTVPALTSLVQPSERMGEYAVRILTDLLSGKNTNCHKRLSTQLRQGQTVADCRKN